jgi:lysozyme
MVVVDMIFNLGSNGFAQFKKLQAALARQDYAGAAQEMRDSRWYRQVGNRGRDDVELMERAAAANH